jgi:hypothetical protein
MPTGHVPPSGFAWHAGAAPPQQGSTQSSAPVQVVDQHAIGSGGPASFGLQTTPVRPTTHRAERQTALPGSPLAQS